MNSKPNPVIFIHGLWIHASSWQPWIDLFAERGYSCSAPGWPGDADTVAGTRENADALDDLGIAAIVEHYAQLINPAGGKHETKPVIVGHSFGGLIAQELLAGGYAAAAVAIDPAPIKGVKALPLAQLRSAFPVLGNPANRHRTVSLTAKQFRYAFGNTLTEQESDALHEQWTIPGPGRPLFQDAAANFVRDSPAAVDTHLVDRGPLLLTSGSEDHTVPLKVTKEVYGLYSKGGSDTEFHEFPGRGHSLTIDSGWREVADVALSWLEKKGFLNAADMGALRAHHRGGPEVLVIERAPVPVPVPGEVLVEVHAAAITFDELTWEETWSRDGKDRTPIIPSHEVSGVVVAKTDAVTEFSVGDEVYGLIRFDRDGAAAEYVTVPAADLAIRPATASHVEAAALPLAGLTAWQALVDHAEVTSGQRVLVHGGAGGVGALTVQLALILGAEVATTVRSDAAREYAATLGAVSVIDTRSESFDAAGASYDVVVDTVGGDTLERSFGVVSAGGKLITLSAPPPPGKADAVGIDAKFFIVEPDRAELGELARLVDETRLHVAIAATYPLAQGRAAFESGRRGGRRPGKTVLSVRD